jgi:hypothetical protein
MRPPGTTPPVVLLGGWLLIMTPGNQPGEHTSQARFAKTFETKEACKQYAAEKRATGPNAETMVDCVEVIHLGTFGEDGKIVPATPMPPLGAPTRPNVPIAVPYGHPNFSAAPGEGAGHVDLTTPARCRQVRSEPQYVPGWGWRTVMSKRCSCVKRPGVPVVKRHTKYDEPGERWCIAQQHFGPPPWPWSSLTEVNRTVSLLQPGVCPEHVQFNKATEQPTTLLQPGVCPEHVQFNKGDRTADERTIAPICLPTTTPPAAAVAEERP